VTFFPNKTIIGHVADTSLVFAERADSLSQKEFVVIRGKFAGSPRDWARIIDVVQECSSCQDVIFSPREYGAVFYGELPPFPWSHAMKSEFLHVVRVLRSVANPMGWDAADLTPYKSAARLSLNPGHTQDFITSKPRGPFFPLGGVPVLFGFVGQEGSVLRRIGKHGETPQWVDVRRALC